MPSSSGEKLCPICDSPLQPGSKKCGFCGTDLSIFEMDLETPPKVPEPAPPRVSIERKVDEVMTRPAAYEPRPAGRPSVSERPAQPPRPAPAPPPVVFAEPEEPVAVHEAEPEAVEPEKPEEVLARFECPECGSMVDATASSCPKCGVIFADEGAEMFQCPACNTLVSVDAKSCPGCGAMFVEPGEGETAAAEAPGRPAPMAKEEIEEPVVEAKPEKSRISKIFEVEKPSEKELPEKKEKGFGKWFRRGKKEPEPEEAEAESKGVMAEEVHRPIPKPAEPAPREIRTERQVTVMPAPAPAAEPVVPVQKDKGRDLARMVAEMKPLLALAREKDVEIGESKQLIDDAAVAGRERQLDRAIELVDKSKKLLMEKIDASLGQEINRLNEEIRVAKEFGGDTARAQTYIQEVARARSTGDAEAAYVYVDKVTRELQPITGRFNDSKQKIAQLKQLVTDCDMFIVDTKEARGMLVETNKAFEARNFDKVDTLTKGATDKLYKAIPARMNDEMRKAKDALLEAKMKGVNIAPLITVLKSSTNLMKSGDYGLALKEMREFKETMKKLAK